MAALHILLWALSTHTQLVICFCFFFFGKRNQRCTLTRMRVVIHARLHSYVFIDVFSVSNTTKYILRRIDHLYSLSLANGHINIRTYWMYVISYQRGIVFNIHAEQTSWIYIMYTQRQMNWTKQTTQFVCGRTRHTYIIYSIFHRKNIVNCSIIDLWIGIYGQTNIAY